MKKLPSSYLEPKIFDNKYIIKQQLSSGSFGIVYLAFHKLTKEEVAVKLEKGEHETLDHEVILLTKLQGIVGVPKLHWFGFEQNYNVMVIELLGKDLGHYSRSYKQLSLKSCLQLIDQLMLIFSNVHAKGIVHRDLKPENIMIGKQNTSLVYLVDFGVSKCVIQKGKHIPFRDKKSFIGTTRYASIAAHKGYEIGKKDDIESMLYVIIYMLLGKLPWQNLQNIGDKDRTIAVGDVKMQTTIKELCKDLPKEFAECLNYLNSLTFETAPDYEMMRNMFKKCGDDRTYDGVFDWTEKQEKQPSFLQVPDICKKRNNSKKQSQASVNGSNSHSTNQVKYMPSNLDVTQNNSKQQQQKQQQQIQQQQQQTNSHIIQLMKITSSQPDIEFNRNCTVEFDDIDENYDDYPTLEEKYLKLLDQSFKFKEEKSISKSAMNIFD